MAGLPDALTRRFVDAYDRDSFSGRARQRRWDVFLRTFPEIAEMSVLDVGGDARAWRLSPVRPARVILLNTFPQEPEEPWMTSIVGDACDPPSALPTTDLTYSNSVIEHVGGHWRRCQFAEAIRRADRYWVQTPNRYFPIEPHFMFPLLQHLPRGLQARVVAHWPFGNHAGVNQRQALHDVLDIELLSAAEMRFYFPDAELWRERFVGLTKSFAAIRR